MERIFGGSPLAVLVRLAVISIVLGIVLSALDISPFDFVASLRRIAVGIWNLGFDWFGSIGRWFVAGAVIVFPIWLVLRLIGLAKGRAVPGPAASRQPTPPASAKDR